MENVIQESKADFNKNLIEFIIDRYELNDKITVAEVEAQIKKDAENEER